MNAQNALTFDVGIIGGQGRMGSWVRALLSGAGHRVSIADLEGPEPSPDWIAGREIIVLTVPVSEVEGVMRNIGPYTRPEQAIIDISSLKRGPLASMLAHGKAEVIGTHPLFGPRAESLAGQLVFLCPGRGRRWLSKLRLFLKSAGARVVQIDAERHDRLMARVQTMRHFLLYSMGLALMDLGFDPDSDADSAGAWFSTLLGLLSRQCEQPPGLYADLALHNPQGLDAAHALQDGVNQMVWALESGRRGQLTEVMERVHSFAKMLPPQIVS